LAEIKITYMKTQIKIAIAITSMSWAILNAEESAKPPTPQPDPQQEEASVKRDKLPYRGVQFEYKIANLHGDATVTTLNSFGEEGWELVAVHPMPEGQRGYLHYLKRQKITTRQRHVPQTNQPQVDPPVKVQPPTPTSKDAPR
jgi:hypothetical protein